MTETDIKTYKPLTVRISASDKPNAPELIVSADTPQELELNLLAIEENTTGATIGRLEEIIRAQYNLGAGLGARGMEAPQNPAPQQPEPAQPQQAPAFHAQQSFPPAQQAPQAQPQQQQAPQFPAPQQAAQGFTQFPTNETSPEWGNPNPSQFPPAQQQGFPAQQQQSFPPAQPQQQQQAPAPQQQTPKQGGGFLGQEPPAPGAPMLAGVGPAKLVKPQDPAKTWAAWADPRPREVTDLIQAKTDDPNDPRLAAGTAKFWAFIQTRR